MHDPRLELILNESNRGADRDTQRLDEVRARSVAILSAASIAAAFLGVAVADGRTKFSAASWVGVASFVVVGLATTFVLLPRKWMSLHDNASELLEHAQDGEDVDTLRSSAISWIEENRRTNGPRLSWLYRALTLACVALTAEVLALLFDLARRR